MIDTSRADTSPADRAPRSEAAEPARVSAPPDIAALVFGDRLPLAERFCEWLARDGVERGLIGPRETARLWDRHLLNCAAAAALIPLGSSVVDIGSGAGLPGIALAIARPDLHLTLVEPMLRRTAFLEEVVADLALQRVQVRRARAEELTAAGSTAEGLAGSGCQADVVSARAVAPIDRLAALAAPLLRPGGQLLALKGSNIVDEVAAGWPAIRRAAMGGAAVLYAVIAASSSTEEPGAPGRSPASQLPAGQLPGVALVQRATWRSDGSVLAAQEPFEAPTPDDGLLALILQLRRST